MTERIILKDRLTTRQRVVSELIETERAYVKSLQVLNDEYMVPLQKLLDYGEPIFKRDEMQAVFGQLPLILPLNKMLLKDLEIEGIDGDVGKVFKQFAPCLKMYHAYLDTAMDNLKLVMEKIKYKEGMALAFARNLLDREITTLQDFCEGKSESLESLIVKPVQRIPRYRMLLEELVKQMSKSGVKDSDPMYKSVEQSLQLVREAADHCNTSVYFQN